MFLSNRKLAVSLFLAVLTFIVYGQSLQNEFSLDDLTFLDQRYTPYYAHLWDYFTSSPSHHYIPLYYWTYNNLYLLFGQNVFALHFIHIILFYLSCLLLYFVLKEFSPNDDIPLLAAVLFCLHPVHSYLVNFMSFGNLMVMAICLLVSLLCFVKAFKSTRFSGGLKALSLIFYLIALLFHVWPAIFPVLLWIFLTILKDKKPVEAFKNIWPYLLITLAYFIVWFTVVDYQSDVKQIFQWVNLSPGQYLGSLSYLVLWYAGNLVWPLHVTVFENILPENSNIFLFFVVCLLFILITRLVHKARFMPKEKQLAWWWFVIGFGPITLTALSHPYMGMVIEPHWFYFNVMGFFWLLVIYLEQLKKVLVPKAWKLSIAGLCLFLGVLTQGYILLHLNEKIYAHYWLKESPQNPLPMMCLGRVYTNEKDYQKAVFYYLKALEVSPYSRTMVYQNLALILDEMGQRASAKNLLFKALESNHLYDKAYNTLGVIAIKENDYAGAEGYFKKAIEANPRSTMAVLNLADVYFKMKDYAKARSLFDHVLKSQPGHSERFSVLVKAAILAMATEDSDRFYQIVQILLKENPTEKVFLSLGQGFESIGQPQLALSILGDYLKTHPKSIEGYLLCGTILANLGDYQQAIAYWEKGRARAFTDPRFGVNIQKAKGLMAQ